MGKIYQPYPPESSLLGDLQNYYSFDDANNPGADLVGTGHLSRVNWGANPYDNHGSASVVAGLLGNAADFRLARTLAHVDQERSPRLISSSQPVCKTAGQALTISLWVRWHSLRSVPNVSVQAILHKRLDGVQEFGLSYSTQLGRLDWGVTTDGTSPIASRAFTPTLERWYHIICGWNDVTFQAELYVDLVLETATGTGSSVSQSTEIRLNGLEDDTLQRPGDFSVDELGIWNRVLSSLERDALYNSGDGLAYPFNYYGARATVLPVA